MQSLFNITSVDTDYSNKQIIIKTTFTVDPKTVNRKNIELIAASSGTTVTYKLKVDDDKIIVTLKEWPEIDSYYVIKIDKIKDKLNRDLITPITKQVIFKTDTKFKVKIISPNNNEAILKEHNLVSFSIKRINPDDTEFENPIPDSDLTSFINSKEVLEKKEAMTEDELNVLYHFEFASDIAFFSIIKDYKTPYTNGYIQLENGQYYMRCRVIENDDIFGDWSDIITFTVVSQPCSNDNVEISQNQKEYIEEIMAPIDFFLDEENFQIVSFSQDGTTYPEFYIEFNKDIDANSLPDSIIAYRRDL